MNFAQNAAAWTLARHFASVVVGAFLSWAVVKTGLVVDPAMHEGLSTGAAAFMIGAFGWGYSWTEKLLKPYMENMPVATSAVALTSDMPTSAAPARPVQEAVMPLTIDAESLREVIAQELRRAASSEEPPPALHEERTWGGADG